MGLIKTMIIIITIIIIFTLFPKFSGGGPICFGCNNMECKCFGKEGTLKIMNYEQDLCLGVPYDCKEKTKEEEIIKNPE